MKPPVACSRPDVPEASRIAINRDIAATRLCPHRAVNIAKLDVSGPSVHSHIPVAFCVQADVTASGFGIEAASHIPCLYISRAGVHLQVACPLSNSRLLRSPSTV